MHMNMWFNAPTTMQIHTYTRAHAHKHIRIHTYAHTRLLGYTIAYAHARNLTIQPERMYTVFGRSLADLLYVFRV